MKLSHLGLLFVENQFHFLKNQINEELSCVSLYKKALDLKEQFILYQFIMCNSFFIQIDILKIGRKYSEK